MKKINWGIIGLGNIANIFAEGFSNLENASIKAVASLNKNNLQSFKKKFQVDNELCFKNYEDLIMFPHIDIIYIALPNSLHAKYIYECIKHNKKVLVEKPAFTNNKDFNVTQNLLDKKNFFFTEAFMYRYLPYIQKIKEIIETNQFGKLIYMESVFNTYVFKQKNFFGIKLMKPDYSHRLFNKDLGGGAILDIGCYPLSLSTLVNSLTYNVNLEKIYLEKVNSSYCESGVDIASEAIINFDNKFRSKISCSFRDKKNQQTIIQFENGTLKIDYSWLPKQNTTIELNRNNEISKISLKNNSNIYSHQIKNISDQLLDDLITPRFPSMTMKEIKTNTKILNDWINFK